MIDQFLMKIQKKKNKKLMKIKKSLINNNRVLIMKIQKVNMQLILKNPIRKEDKLYFLK